MLTYLVLLRLRAAALSRADVTRPKSVFTKSVSTITAVMRESSYLQYTPLAVARFIRLPPFGPIILVLCYFGWILGLEFTNADYAGAQHNQALGIRAGWLAVSQFPLLALTASKTNIIGYLTGSSYERLNVYHRWVARGLLMLATMHFVFQSVGWDEYGLLTLEWDTDTCPPTGIAAYAIVLWMNLTTLAPFRNTSYQIFVIQHIITFLGLIVAVMMHLPSTALYSRIYVWITIGLYLFDRSCRTVWYLWTNITFASARLEALDDAAVKVRLTARQIKRWTPGSHVRLRFLKLGVWHSHPATIVSHPSSHNGDLVFILRTRGWFTKKLSKETAGLNQSSTSPGATSLKVLVSGPYRSAHNDFLAYDTAVLIAGGTGIAFTTSILLDLAARVEANPKVPLHTVNFVWIVRHKCWVRWTANELQTAGKTLHDAGIDVKIQICVTSQRGSEDAMIDSSSNSVSASPAESPMRSDLKEQPAHCSPIPMFTYSCGRPDLHGLLSQTIQRADGETAVGVCGSIGLTTCVRSAVVRISDDRAVHKGTGAQGIYLHVGNVDYC